MSINFLSAEEKRIKIAKRREQIFINYPIWKSVLVMSWPALLQMLVFGSYMFADSILAINFAADSYKSLPGLSAESQVRVFMNGAAPIVNLMSSVTILFSIGIATRVSINLGSGKTERAISTLRTGMMVAMLTSILLIPVLIFATKPWVASQYSQVPQQVLDLITEQSFNYTWILIASLPIQFYGQITASLFRIEGKNREMLVATIVPIIVNLTFDWILMGPVGLAIEGGAWATFIANGLAALICAFYVWHIKSDILNFQTMFGFKIKFITLVGVILVGIAPFLRQMAQSITQTITMNVIQTLSGILYHEAQVLPVVLSAVLPVFLLFFPVVLGFSSAARPIAAFNYGAKKFDRIKQVYLFTIIYAFITGIILYFLSSWILTPYLFDALHLNDENMRRIATNIIRIMMLSVVIFAPGISGMILFGSTDRILLAIISSSLRGLIFFFPFMYGFNEIAQSNPQEEFLFWWYYPILTFTTSVSITLVSLLVLKRIKLRHTTLDERIARVYAWNNHRLEKRALRRSAKDKD